MTTFASRLELLMFEQKVNKSQLAKKLNLAPSTVYRWFERNSTPNLETVVQVAEMFGVSVDWLRGVTEDRTAPTIPMFEPIHEEIIKEDELDQELVRLIRGLTPAQQQRVRDFLAGLRG